MNAGELAEITSCLDHICKQAFLVLAGMDAVTINKLSSEARTITCRISIKDDQGSQSDLLILADARFAVCFTQGLLATSARDVNDEDVADAIGELANTIGGNLKGIMEAETSLSIPEFSFDPSLCRVEPQTKLGYRFSNAGECVVELFTAEAAANV